MRHAFKAVESSDTAGVKQGDPILDALHATFLVSELSCEDRNSNS